MAEPPSAGLSPGKQPRGNGKQGAHKAGETGPVAGAEQRQVGIGRHSPPALALLPRHPFVGAPVASRLLSWLEVTSQPSESHRELIPSQQEGLARVAHRRIRRRSFRVPLSWNGPFKPSSAKYPLIIFSHSLGTFRTVYSAVCAELASRGFVVAALEHRDHSASATYFCAGEAGEELREEWIPYEPVPPGQKEFYFRNKQLHQRADECVRALRLFEDVSRGRAAPNVLPGGFDLSVLQDSVDVSKAAVMGHSFGAVTAVLATVKEPRFGSRPRRPASPQPSLPLLSGSVHQSQSDITFLTGRFVNRILTTRGTLDPHKALDITCQAALAFLQRHLDLNEDFDQWDQLLEGIGDSVVADAPLPRSNL
ncbi:PREDICTED: platelet-activating factor acetylhydrolase 2, cytoplasmic [Tinamus guttatus]|uniref:platelet-activating factor acetylhydrolase 2, cytoplasmic n=1 Tax=Tinamus guttatus TaxID=94827 RepID=UPI00052F1034|nr:PREDICTED: platelet-activating factor acetylhydrolase 2, cytoplasmic [Tinamus guttatus]